MRAPGVRHSSPVQQLSDSLGVTFPLQHSAVSVSDCQTTHTMSSPSLALRNDNTWLVPFLADTSTTLHPILSLSLVSMVSMVSMVSRCSSPGVQLWQRP